MLAMKSKISSIWLGENGREITVHEWWLVSNDFAYAAKQEGEIIVDTPFGAIWGRQYNGPLIAMDLCVESILKAIDDFRRPMLTSNKSE